MFSVIYLILRRFNPVKISEYEVLINLFDIRSEVSFFSLSVSLC